DASEGREVVRDMKAGKGGNENGRCSVKGAEFHLKTTNVQGNGRAACGASLLTAVLGVTCARA
ncbi:MAG: hypothetical protein ACKOB5_15980, partial [Betaproteobacteria bacterium]